MDGETVILKSNLPESKGDIFTQRIEFRVLAEPLLNLRKQLEKRSSTDLSPDTKDSETVQEKIEHMKEALKKIKLDTTIWTKTKFFFFFRFKLLRDM